MIIKKDERLCDKKLKYQAALLRVFDTDGSVPHARQSLATAKTSSFARKQITDASTSETWGNSFSRVSTVIDCTVPHLPHNYLKPFTRSYETISRIYHVIAFDRPSLSPDLISENVSSNSGNKSLSNGHFQ